MKSNDKPLVSNKNKKKLRNAIARVKNALINGAAGAGLGGALHAGESGYKGARIGAGAGALIGLLQNPRKRSATADSVAQGGDFTFSAHIEDMRLDSLPQATRNDINRFVDAKPHFKVIHYGMVPSELVMKADQHNLKAADEHVKEVSEDDAKNHVLEATKSGSKYVLLMNDTIVDGHHFLAKARRGGVTSSLNVIDLTPLRFQTSTKRRKSFAFSEKFSGFRKEHQNPNGGLNAKGRAAYNRATGSNLKAPQPKGGKRRDSFCARMQGMKEKLTSEKTANDPNSRINKSLRAWKCDDKRQATELSAQSSYPYRDPAEEEKKDVKIRRTRKGLKVAIRGALNSLEARHEFGILAGLAGQMAVSPFTDKARKRIYQGVRGRIKNRKWGQRAARAASYAPDAIIGGGASIAADAAWEKFKPKKKEVATEFAEKDDGKLSRGKAYGIIAGGAVGALAADRIATKALIRSIRKGRKPSIRKVAATRALAPLVGGTAGSYVTTKALRQKLTEKNRDHDSSRISYAADNARSYSSSGVMGAVAGMAVGGALKGKSGVNRRSAIAGGLTAVAARALLQKRINKEEDKYLKKKNPGIADVAKHAGKSIAYHQAIPAAAGASAIGAMIASRKLINSSAGRKIKAAILKRQRAKNPVRRTKVVPKGKIIDADTGMPPLALPAKRMSSSERLTELSKDMDQIERAYRVGDIHSRQGKVYARLEPTEKKKRRDPLKTTRDAALTAGGAGLLYGGLRVGKEVNKTGRKARDTMDDLSKTVKSGVGSVKDTAEQAIKGVKSSVQNVVYDYHPQAVTDAIGDTVKSNVKGAIKRRFPRLSKIASKLLGKKIHASAKMKRLVELAHYPADHPYWDDFREEPVKRKAVTPEEMEEVKRDRRKLLGIAAKAALLAPVAAYAVSGNEGVKAARQFVGDKLKSATPGLAKNRHIKKAFPPTPDIKSVPAKKAPEQPIRMPKRPKKASELSAILFSDRDQLVDSDHRWASAWKGLRGGRVYRNKKRADGSLARSGDVFDALTGKIIKGEGSLVRERVTRGELIGQGQTIRSVYRGAKKVHKQGGRAVGLVKDAVDTIRGVPRQKDPWGRRRKREWEKPWFKNAAGATAITVGGLALLKNPVVARKANKAMKKASNAANKIIPGIVPQAYESIRRIGEVLNEFDETAPEWDIRDQRGKSARVFAPGSRKRERREKMWHEKIGNERKLWGAGVIASGLLGAGVTRQLVKRGIKSESDIIKSYMKRNNAKSQISRKHNSINKTNPGKISKFPGDTKAG